MLNVNEGGNTAPTLCFSDDVLADRGLTRRLRPKDLADAPAWQAANTEREIQRDCTGWNGVNLKSLTRPELHDRTATELLLNGEDCGIYRAAALR